MTSHLSIQGFGAYVPARRLSNADLERLVDTSDEWIVTRTGIRNRHVLADDESGADAGTIAARRALEAAGLAPEDITHVITATCTPDFLCPNTACLISANLGIHGPMAFDLSSACSGFVYGLETARGLVLAHPDAKILLVSTEALTRRINWKDRGTSVVFGDGAGAAVVSACAEGKAPAGGALIEDVVCHADGGQWKLLTVGGGTKQRYEAGDPVDEAFYIHMEGREIYKNAVRTLTNVCHEIVERNGYTLDDIDVLVPHQANLRIIEAVGERLGMGEDRVFVNIQDYGNTSAASIPLALNDAWRAGVFKPGMLALLTTFGGGFTWGAALLRF